MNTTCTSCGHDLWQDELGNQGCGACQRRVDRALAELVGPRGLYAQLTDVLTPGTTGAGNRVSGSKNPPIPVRLAALNLQARGGVVTILQTWLVDWHDHLGYTHPRWDGGPQDQLDQTVARLRTLLPWAVEHHPAWAEFAGEVRQAVGACRAQVTGEPPARRVTVTCTCGAALRITLDTPGRRCACGQQYGWAELRRLPLAQGAAA
ncbi:hypothetical protein [Streptomyces cacaoi]|uniref:hypothetical protein n=1 Tax=Streptomyces cacaoi TaxID=1898 RepID=UPI0037499157